MVHWKDIKQLDRYKTDYCLEDEIWLDLPEYEEHYQYSNFGRLRSKDRIRIQKHVSGKMIQRFYEGKLINPDMSDTTFGILHIYKGKKKVKSISVYILVCQGFGQEYADNFFYGNHTPTNLPGEIWKDVKGYEGLYKVSNLGRVKKPMGSYDIIMKPFIDSHGYWVATLSKNDKANNYMVHRLVADAFIPNSDPEHKIQVNHIDGDKQNAKVENLEWVTPSENIQHAIRTGLFKISPYTRQRSKESTSIPVYCKELDVTFSSISEASNALGIKKSRVYRYSLLGQKVDGYTFERRSK